jgi:hypothetical protein
MVVILFAGIVFLCLVIGSLVFVASVLMPQARRHALSAALWCAMWGPCSVALIVLAGAGLIVSSLLTKAGGLQWPPPLGVLNTLGFGYLCLGLLANAAVATGSAWIHQKVIERLTLALFRLYAAAVSAGIGSVFGCTFGLWLTSKNMSGYLQSILWIICTLTLMAGFGIAAFRGARALRGEAPKGFTWISTAEFEGN